MKAVKARCQWHRALVHAHSWHGVAEVALKLVSRLKLVIPATSLGGVESLIEHRATIEGDHSDVPKGLLRLSAGVENPEDILADLFQALE